VWILFAINRWFDGGPPSHVTAALLVTATILTQLFSNAHTMATLVRVYEDGEAARRFSFYTRWLPILCALITIPGLFVPGMAGVFLKLYLVFLLPHHTLQVYGISLIYCYKRGYVLNDREKHVFKAFMLATAWFPILRQSAYASWGAGRVFMYQPIPFWGPIPEWIPQAALLALIASGSLFAVIVLRKAITARQFLPLPAVLLIGTVVPYMMLGGRDSTLLWLYVTPLFHGSQYIIVSTAYYLKSHGLPEGITPQHIFSMLGRARALRYLGLLVLGGSFIYVGIPRLLEELGVPFTVSAGVILAVFNFHHFLTDRAVWRLRDPAVRRTLIA